MQKMIYLAETKDERVCPIEGVTTLYPSDPDRLRAIETAQIIFGNPTTE